MPIEGPSMAEVNCGPSWIHAATSVEQPNSAATTGMSSPSRVPFIA